MVELVEMRKVISIIGQYATDSDVKINAKLARQSPSRFAVREESPGCTEQDDG